MPFIVNYKIFEPGKIAPSYQTTDRKLAYIEWNHRKSMYGADPMVRMVPDVDYIDGNKQDEYVWLVYRVLKAIRKYYDERNYVPKSQSDENLRNSLALEKALDRWNAKTRVWVDQHPKMTPENPKAFAFFEWVELWRKRWHEYFAYKKRTDKDPKWEAKLRDDCLAMEKEIKKYVRSAIGI